jgi:hypothetical protein
MFISLTIRDRGGQRDARGTDQTHLGG